MERMIDSVSYLIIGAPLVAVYDTARSHVSNTGEQCIAASRRATSTKKLQRPNQIKICYRMNQWKNCWHRNGSRHDFFH